MNRRSVSLFVSAGIFLAFLMGAAIHQSAQAKTCYNGQNQVVPCPNYQNPTQPPPPTAPPVPVDAATPPACAPVTGPSDSGQAPTEGNGSFFSPGLLLGGGGLLGGLLIGLLIGSYVIGPMMNRGLVGPTDSHGVVIQGGDQGVVIQGGDQGFDGITERDVPERPPGSPRPEPQPRLDGSLLDDSTSPKIGPKHDDPNPPPPDSDAPDVAGGDTSTDLDLDVHLDVPD